MRVLVTGGAGYIGSISVRVLVDAGHDVAVVDSLARGHREAVDARAELIIGDVGDRSVLDAVVPGCDAVLHCAGLIEVAESQRSPDEYFEANVVRPLALLRAMVDHGVDAITFSSTAAVYGEPMDTPIIETSPTRPINVYGMTKLAFEHALRGYDVAYGMRSIRFRYFNVAGAWPDGSMGEAHDPETHIVPRVLRAIAAGENRFEMYGDSYPTPDGTCVRDYLHVLDLAEAHRLALERLADGGDGGVFNLGSGRGFSNLEVVAACATVTGTEPEIQIGPPRDGDPAVLVASSARAEDELGWRRSRGELTEMIRDAWAWHESHPEGYRSQG